MCSIQEGTRQGELFYDSGCIDSHVCYVLFVRMLNEVILLTERHISKIPGT